jgi:exonuclease III
VNYCRILFVNMAQLSVATFNLHGIKLGQSMLLDLFMRTDIICVQEHWLCCSKLQTLETMNVDFGVISVSSMEQNIRNEIISGRPYGGTAIFWRRNKMHNVSTYSMNGCGRCVDISFSNTRGYCFIFNLYLPCISNYNDGNDTEVLECMSFIDKCVQDFAESNGACDIVVIVAGDFNASLFALYNDSKLNVVKTLLDDFELACCDDLDVSNIGYTYYHEGLDCKSYIDHMFITESWKSSVRKLEVIDDGNNLSDHTTL